MKGEFELEQESTVPDSIERLSDIEKEAPLRSSKGKIELFIGPVVL